MRCARISSSLLASYLLLAASAPAEILERVVAKVNGDIVTLSEFQARQVAAVQAAGGLTTDDRIERFLRENNARILQEAIDDLLLVQKAQELGMRLRPEYIKDIIEGIKKENNIAERRRAAAAAAAGGHVARRPEAEHRALHHEAAAAVPRAGGEVAVSEAEVRADYEAQPRRVRPPREPAPAGDPGHDAEREPGAGRRPGARARAPAKTSRSWPARYSVAAHAPAGGDLGRLTGGT